MKVAQAGSLIACAMLACCTAQAVAVLRIEGQPGLSVQVDGAYVGEIPVGATALQISEPALGMRRLTLLRGGKTVHEGRVRIRNDNLIVLREPDFHAPPLPHPNESLRSGTLIVRGFTSLQSLAIPGLLDEFRPTDSQTVFTRLPAGKYQAVVTDAMLGSKECINFEIKAEQIALLRVDSASPADRIGYSRLTSVGGTYDRQIPGLGLHLVWLEPGGFERAESTRAGRTRPAARVRLAEGFWIGRTEVTQAQWQAVMDANPSQFKEVERPVERVTWDEAMEFCRRLTETERAAGRLPVDAAYTLPTEAQWEYACRAGTMTPSASAAQLRQTSWLHNEHNHQTQMTGVLAENEWGIADLVGNVAEWCLDVDPEMPQVRIARGGSYDTSLLNAEVFALANLVHSQARNPSVGLRIVLINTVRD